MSEAPEGTLAFAAVAIPVPARKLFVYEVPVELRSRLARGARVRVPFGRRHLSGTVVEWPSPPPPETVRTKRIEAILGDEPAMSADLLDLTRFVPDYYLCSWGEAIETAMPPRARAAPRERWVRRVEDPELRGRPAQRLPGFQVGRALLAGIPPEQWIP